MAQEIITLENLAAEIAKLRGELATWKALAIKQDRLNTAQMLAVNSGATAGKIAQIATNTSDIAALQQIASSAFRVVKVAQLPASGEPYIMYLVPQTDGETLNYCNEYLWIDNAWELVGTTGAMANNGELQIIVNGVTVGTFTANQATDSTASITVPTDTSQLTNSAGYVDATALATALASKQDSLSLTQLAAVNSGITSADVAQIGANTTAIAGKQDALTTSQLAAVNSGITSADVTQIGTNAGNIATNSAAIISLQGSKQNTLSAAQLLAVNSGITSSLVTQIGTNQSDITTLNTALGQSLTPSADDTYSLGGASFRYANIYAVTFTGDLTGTASKAIADENGTSIKTGYGKLAGNQTWTGANTILNKDITLKNSGVVLGENPTGQRVTKVLFNDNSDAECQSIQFTQRADGYTFTQIIAGDKYLNGVKSSSGSLIQGNFIIGVSSEGKAFLSTNNLWRSNLLPYSNSSYGLGSSSLRWSAVYADSYYYGTTAWGLDKGNVWSGDNTYTNTYLTQKQTGLEMGELPASNQIRRYRFTDKNNTSLGWLQHRVNTSGESYLELLVDNKFSNGQLSTQGDEIYNTLVVGLHSDGSRYVTVSGDVYPDYANRVCNLGTSTNKWKTLNGINPGALSLPNYSSTAKVDISGSIIPDQYNNIYYTPTINGWLYVCFNISSATTSSSIFYIQAKDNNVANSSFVQTSWALASVNPENLAIFFPVVANKRFIMQINFSNYTIIKAHVIPCLGNV